MLDTDQNSARGAPWVAGTVERMRIICPNCDAQYEVPGSVIPHDGRDVECSNCGKTWFQHHPDFPIDLEDAAADPAPQLDTQPEPSAVSEPPSVPAPTKREIDPNVADVLREEAERETAARAAEALEVQTDLNLPEAEPAPSVPVAEQPNAAAEPAQTTIDEPVNSRRELLPDIEEINSTLRSAEDRDVAGGGISPDAPIRIRKKRSFRRGFVVSMAVFAAAVLLYVFAPQIAETFPQADPWISSYVTWVDNQRVWLNGHMATLLEWLEAQAEAADQS